MNGIETLVAQIFPKIASDPAVAAAIKEKIVNHIKEHGIEGVPGLDVLIADLLKSFFSEEALEDDDIKQALKDSLDFEELTGKFMDSSDALKKAFEEKLTEAIKACIENWDMSDDETITDDIDDVLFVDKDLIKKVIADSSEIQEALAEKMKDEIMSFIENTDWSEDKDLDNAIESGLDYLAAARKLCATDPDVREKLEEYINSAIDSWIENLDVSDPKTIEKLVDSPVIIELVDQVLAKKISSDSLLRQKIEALVESALSNPLRLQPLVDKRVAEIIAAMATQKPQSGS